MATGALDLSTITKEDPYSLLREAFILRGTALNQARQLSTFKAIRIQADPGIPLPAKAEALRALDAAMTGLCSLTKTPQPAKKQESIEDYYARVIQAFNEQK